MSKSVNSAALLVLATDFAARKHSTQRRKDAAKTPFINHPIGVAQLLCECGVYNKIVLAAALLHDTLEDTDTTVDELCVVFGDHIAMVVSEVTDNKRLRKDERKRQQIVHAAHISSAAKMVKLADKLYNLTSMLTMPPPAWSVARVQGYFVWAKAVVAQLAGTNVLLEQRLDKVLSTMWHYADNPDVLYPAIPDGDEAELLERYLADMAATSD